MPQIDGKAQPSPKAPHPMSDLQNESDLPVNPAPSPYRLSSERVWQDETGPASDWAISHEALPVKTDANADLQPEKLSARSQRVTAKRDGWI